MKLESERLKELSTEQLRELIIEQATEIDQLKARVLELEQEIKKLKVSGDSDGSLVSDYESAISLEKILIARATSEEADDSAYRENRRNLMQNRSLGDVIPDIVRDNHNLDQFWGFIKVEFSTYQERRSYIWNKFKPLLNRIEVSNHAPIENVITEILRQFSSDEIHAVWQKCLQRKDKDPEGVITLSRTLLEAICKHILDEFGIEYDTNKIELSELYKKTSQELNLAPSQHTEKVFKEILSSCTSIVNGLGTVRNRLGDAHGKGKAQYKPKPRHAELGLNLAGSMALYLVQTFHAKSSELRG
jgi:hypothetical protein